MSKTNSLHYKLCCLGAKWLYRPKGKIEGCKYVAVELVTIAADNPDVWGTTGYSSTMIEVKVSRTDFLKDKEKFARQNTEYATGNFRYYLAPETLIQIEELPEDWGLLEVSDDTGKIVVVKKAEYQLVNNRSELALLCSIMRREGIKQQIFNYRK